MASTAPSDVYVATILRPEGETGVQTHARAFVRAAGRSGVRAQLVTPFDGARAVVYPVFGAGRLIKPLSKPAWVWWYRRMHGEVLRRVLLRRLDGRSPAVIYAQDPLSARAALAVKARGDPVEVALVVHFNVSQADEWAERGFIREGGPLYRRIEAFEAAVLPRVDRLIVTSRYILDRVAERVPGIAGVPQWCIPNFVPPAETAGREPPAGDLISIGTLEPRKNHEFLLRVLAACHRMGRRYRLTIVGDGPLRARLVARAQELGVSPWLELTGYVRGAAALLPRYRAYVHAATMENCPLSMLEALAAGRPVFAPGVGGIPEVVEDGVVGGIWDLGDAESAARALVRVLEDAPLYERISRAAARRYRERFSPEAVGPRLLEAVLGRVPPGGAVSGGA